MNGITKISVREGTNDTNSTCWKGAPRRDDKHVALKTAQQRRRRRREFDVGCGESLETSKHEN